MTLPLHRFEDLKTISLYADESVTDLVRAGMRLIQSTKGFRFGEDTILLADFAAQQFSRQMNRRLRIADLGAGCGASTLLMAARLPASSILAVEMDPHSVSALSRNIQLNGLSGRLSVLDSDYSRWDEKMPHASDGTALAGSFDLVITNPPYRLARQGLRVNDHLRQSCEEQSMTLATLMNAARLLLKPSGRLVMVHQAARLTDILIQMRKNQIEPKTLRFVSSVVNRPPVRLLLAGIHHARPGSLSVQLPLVVRDEQHCLTEEIRHIYSNDSLLTQEDLNAGLVRLDEDWQIGMCLPANAVGKFGGLS